MFLIFLLMLLLFTYSKAIVIKNENRYDVIIIGDSLIVGIKPTLNKELKKYNISYKIDAKIGRHFKESIQLINSKNYVAEIHVINLFNNSPVTIADINILLNTIKQKNSNSKIIFINTHIQKSNIIRNNNILENYYNKNNINNIIIIDWNKYFINNCQQLNKNICLADDNIHLNNYGNQLYSRLILNEIKRLYQNF